MREGIRGKFEFVNDSGEHDDSILGGMARQYPISFSLFTGPPVFVFVGE